MEALSLVRGQVHELEDVEARIDALAAMLRASPELAAIVAVQAAAETAGRAASSDGGSIDRAALMAASGGPAFVAALDDFLAQHGHLGQNHDDLLAASWAEAPAMLFANLARRMSGAGAAADARLAELRRVAAERAAAARARSPIDRTSWRDSRRPSPTRSRSAT